MTKKNTAVFFSLLLILFACSTQSDNSDHSKTINFASSEVLARENASKNLEQIDEDTKIVDLKELGARILILSKVEASEDSDQPYKDGNWHLYFKNGIRVTRDDAYDSEPHCSINWFEKGTRSHLESNRLYDEQLSFTEWGSDNLVYISGYRRKGNGSLEYVYMFCYDPRNEAKDITIGFFNKMTGGQLISFVK